MSAQTAGKHPPESESPAPGKGPDRGVQLAGGTRSSIADLDAAHRELLAYSLAYRAHTPRHAVKARARQRSQQARAAHFTRYPRGGAS